MTTKSWLGAVVFFFAWGFVLHGAGLVLHEVGGHGVVGMTLGCGLAGIDLTYFGHGVVHYVTPCSRWTWTTSVVADWSGLALTIGAGAVALAFGRRARFRPMTRLLLSILATGFLLGQLSYATTGGFNDLYDPARTARALGTRGLHVLAWLPPLALFVASAFLGARAITGSLRDHFRPRSRLQALAQIAATLGVSGVLYLVAFRIEWAIRADIAMRGVAFEAERIAAAHHEAPPFPIERVLVAIAIVAFIAALARPLRADGDAGGAGADGGIDGGAVSRRHARFVALAALATFVVISVLVRV
jgi:hypothetical protein